MLLFSVIVSILLAFLRYDTKKEIIRSALKLFAYMVGGVILFSWIMFLL